ncbi:MAG: hypothetical protein Q7R84_00710 [bacterium]|nr:hypothetical protein [bacterium]
MAHKVVIEIKDIAGTEFENELFELLHTCGQCEPDIIVKILKNKFIFASDREIYSALENLIKENKVSRAPLSDASDDIYCYFTKVTHR